MSLLQCLRFNQMTAYPWSLEKTVRNCSTNGIPYIGVWRHKLTGVKRRHRVIRREGLLAASLCRRGVVLFLSGAAQAPSYGIFC
jgi:hypothetical protein